MLKVPNILTMARIAVIPLLVVLIWIGSPTVRWIALSLYILACQTDYLHGYLARSLDLQSSIGRMFDPIADKLLVGGCILALCAFDYITGWAVLPATVILLREILVSGLREYLAEIRVGLPVSRLAKWKTMTQMVFLGFLIIGDAGPPVLEFDVTLIGEVGLCVAALLSLWTGYDYLRSALSHAASQDLGSNAAAQDHGRSLRREYEVGRDSAEGTGRG